MAELVERTRRVAGLELFARESAGSPDALPVVFVHGFAISGRYFLPTASELAAWHSVYVPDLPGHGRSDDPAHPLSIAESADALIAYLDAAGVARAIVLGHSSGGLVAIDVANRYPGRVERVVLVSPAGGPDNQPLARALFQLALDGTREPPGLLRIALGDYGRFGLLDSLRAFHRMTRFPEIEAARELRVPALVVVGGRDPMVSLETVCAVLESTHDMTLVLLPEAAHAINFGHGPLLARLVRDYLADATFAHARVELPGVHLVGMTEAAHGRIGRSGAR